LFQKEVPRRRFPFAVVFICFSILQWSPLVVILDTIFSFRGVEQHPIVVDTSVAGKFFPWLLLPKWIRSDDGGLLLLWSR
jgi:hypothetical protein